MKCKQCKDTGTIIAHKGNDSWEQKCPFCLGNQPESQDMYTCEPHGIENCPQCRFNPDPPEERQDERIWEMWLNHDVIEDDNYSFFKAGFKSRDAELEKAERVNLGLHREITCLNEQIKEILAALDTTIEERDEYSKEIDELKVKIEEMKCCFNCGHRFDGEYLDTCTGVSCINNLYDNWKRRSE